jgi:DNA invertase Pin-like site-specific DNA recombinase
MKRAATYARYSSDLQDDRSITDQNRLNDQIAARHSLDIVRRFEDREISAASIVTRPGFQAMMSAAKAREFDFIIIEDVDRAFRSQADYHTTRRQLKFIGVEIIANSGVVSGLEGSVRAMIAEHQLENMAGHIHRTMSGIAAEGRHCGGRAYGYRAIPGRPGELEIVEAEAEIIRRIFKSYVDGETPNAIAMKLNAERITPPRGSFWRPSSLLGSKRRGHGLLRNEIYRGVLIWNRVGMVKNPDTGRRVSRVNAASDWQRADAPHLRVVTEDVFNAAQRRMEARTFDAPKGARRTKYLLSGLLRCGACGSGMEIKDRDCGRIRIRCVNAKHGAGCHNTRVFHLAPIERAVVGGLKKHIGSKQAIGYYVKVFNEEQRRQSAGAAAARAKLEVKLADAERGIDRLIGAIAEGAITTDEARKRMPALRSELEAAKIWIVWIN